MLFAIPIPCILELQGYTMHRYAKFDVIGLIHGDRHFLSVN